MKFGQFSLKKISKKGAVFGISAGVALGLTGAAFAYWTSSGGNTNGTATTGTPNAALTVVQTTNSITDLAPGVGPEVVGGTITNTSATQKTFVNQVVITIGSVAKVTTPPAPGICATTDYQLGGVSNGTVTVPVNLELAAGASTPFTTSAANGIGFFDTASNQNGCQGATVTLHYVAS
jgi:hypothetical protein